MARRGSQGGNGFSYHGRDRTASDNSGRIFFILLIFAAVTLIVLLRLVYLQVIVADQYSAEAKAARTTNIETSPRRGTIYDRNGNILAMNVDATTIYVNPYEVKDVDKEAAQLASALGGDVESYKTKLSQQNSSFAYIKRKADVDEAQKVEALDLDGIYFIADTKRVYPNNQVGGQIIGFVNVDGKGISGLELYYDEILKGTPGTLVVERGSQGMPIPGGVHQETPAVNGQDIIVSLDIGMQEYLENRLAQGVADVGGTSGNATIMDASTGEILACASLPYFNPSDTTTVAEGSDQAKAITDSFEPGSTFKAVSALAILEAGILTPDSTLFAPASLQADEYTVTDAHERNDETMTFRDILARSSNVGISLATEKLGFAEFYQKILAYHFTEKTGVDYPGEASGYLLDQKQWSLIKSYNVSFGQGVSVTPLQMVRFYGAIVNNGVECVPHFLIEKPHSDDEITYPTEDVVENKKALSSLTSMLESVVETGTATDAAIPGFKVAGKTGTAEIAKEGGYHTGLYNISFVGFLPDSTSQLVCFVGANEVPADRKVGSVFKDIMSFAIDRYKIMPTKG